MTIIIHDIPMMHIMDVAEITGRSVTSLRYLIEHGNTIRKLKFYRDRSKLYIPVAELYGYPFISRGGGEHRQIYHYNDKFEKYLCTECTFGTGCAGRETADNLEVPEGDI